MARLSRYWFYPLATVVGAWPIRDRVWPVVTEMRWGGELREAVVVLRAGVRDVGGIGRTLSVEPGPVDSKSSAPVLEPSGWKAGARSDDRWPP